MKPVGFIKGKCHTESNRTVTDDRKLYKHYCGFISVWVMYSMVKIKQNLALDKSNNSLLRPMEIYFLFASAPAWIFAATSKYFIVRRRCFGFLSPFLDNFEYPKICPFLEAVERRSE